MLPLQNLSAFPFLSDIPSGVLLAALVLLLAWTTVIKAFALWYAARNNQPFWFIAMLVLNTLGVIELVYLLGFRKDKQVYGAKPEVVASEAPGA